MASLRQKWANFFNGDTGAQLDWLNKAAAQGFTANDVFNVNTDGGRALAVGESVYPRMWTGNNGQVANSGVVYIAWFTATKTETVNNLTSFSGANAQTTATLCKMGLYGENPDNSITLLSQTASDTTMWGSAYSTVNRPLLTPVSKVKGQRYGFAILQVGASGLNILGNNAGNSTVLYNLPRLSDTLSGQSDFPASVTFAARTVSNGIYLQGFVLP